MGHIVVMWFQFNEACNARIQESDTAIDECGRQEEREREEKRERGKKRKQKQARREDRGVPRGSFLPGWADSL